MKFIYYILVCPTTDTVPNLLWVAFWLTIGIIICCNWDMLAGLLLWVALGIAKGVWMMHWEKDNPQKMPPVVYVPYDCGGGDGFFDEVSDRRRADIEFLFGKRE